MKGKNKKEGTFCGGRFAGSKGDAVEFGIWSCMESCLLAMAESIVGCCNSWILLRFRHWNRSSLAMQETLLDTVSIAGACGHGRCVMKE